jgi:hypothetical protein
VADEPPKFEPSDRTHLFLPEEPVGNRQVRPYTKAPKGLRIRDERVRRQARRTLAAYPHLLELDRDVVRAKCQVSILREELYMKIRTEGVVRPDGQPHALLSEFRGLVKVEADLAGRLGMTPRDRAMMRNQQGPNDLISRMAALAVNANRAVNAEVEVVENGKPE